MASYLKLFVDCLEKYQKLSDSEFGRLVRAALRYKATGAEPTDLGREELLWDGIKLDIDRDTEKYANVVAARSEAGKKGGRPKKQKKQMLFEESKKSQDKDKEEDKDKDKDKEGIIPPKSPQGDLPGAKRSEPPAIELPLNTGELYPVTQKDIDHWGELYPAVDVLGQLRKMVGWLEANPARRKTKSGIKRFVTAWLAREQDKGKAAQKPASFDFDQLEEMSKFDVPEGL